MFFLTQLPFKHTASDLVKDKAQKNETKNLINLLHAGD